MSQQGCRVVAASDSLIMQGSARLCPRFAHARRERSISLRGAGTAFAPLSGGCDKASSRAHAEQPIQWGSEPRHLSKNVAHRPDAAPKAFLTKGARTR